MPIVIVLVNGGDGTLEEAAEKLPSGVPLVTIAGSGRAADVIAAIHRRFYVFPLSQISDDSRDNELRDIYEGIMNKRKASQKVVMDLRIIANHIGLVSDCLWHHPAA